MTDLKIHAVEPCKAVSSGCSASPQHYASRMPAYSGSDDPVKVAAYAMRQLEAARQQDVDTHTRNLPALQANQAVHDHIKSVMEAVGMPLRWSERDTKSRSRYPKTISHEAGYLADLRREVIVNDNFEYATTCYQRLLKDYEAYAQQAAAESAQKVAAVQRQRDAEVAKRRADMELAAMLLRYGLPIESTWRDVVRALAGKHQRLALAIAMRQTRSDWSEGPWRVRDALAAFQIETTEDKDIANDVLSCLDDFCDGRVFRDTTWSYDALFASISDQQLAADAQTALSHCTD